MVALYCYIVGRSLVKMYSAKSRADFVNLRYLRNNLPPVMKKVLKDRDIEVVQLKCSGLPGTEIARKLNISTTRQREIFSGSVRKLRFYSDYYTYELCDGGGWKLVIDGKRERRIAENSIAMRDVPLELGITELGLPDKLCILLERRGMHTVGDMIEMCRAESNGYLRLDLLASSLDNIPQVGQKSKEAIVNGIRRCCESSDTARELNPLLSDLNSVGLSTRVDRTLRKVGIQTVGEALELFEYRISSPGFLWGRFLERCGVHKFGIQAARELSRALVSYCEKTNIEYK